MGVLVLTRDEAEELIYSDKVVRDRIVSKGRWTVNHEVIFRHDDGQLYKVKYSVGATEYQYEQPFEYEDVVNCVPVREIPAIDYEEIK